jgi:hypothetical protein
MNYRVYKSIAICNACEEAKIKQAKPGVTAGLEQLVKALALHLTLEMALDRIHKP